MDSKQILLLSKQGRSNELIGLLPTLEVDQRELALGGLAKIAPHEAIGVFATTVQADDDLVCRMHAIRGLKSIGGSEAENALLLALPLEQNPGVTVRILDALGEIGSESSIVGLSRYTEAPDKHVRFKAFEALLEIGVSKKSETPLLRGLEDSDFAIRFLVLAALDEYGSDSARAAVTDRLGEENIFVRAFYSIRRRALRRVRDGVDP